ncbi:MAG: NFACT family protein [Clostridia bacterium]|nr:NFACT family protein [Clostridia bacterium]
MPQDAYTLRRLCLELNNIFKDAKVNRIVCPDNDEIILTLFTGKTTLKLLLSVNPGSPRIGITETEKEGLLMATNFCMLLRKHLLSARVKEISLVGYDRIVKIDLCNTAEFSDEKEYSLYVELMGRYSNVILTEQGKVLGGNRGINMFDDGVRPLIVGKPYVFPPDNGKLLPSNDYLKEKLKTYNDGNLVNFITQNVQGIATSTATELVFLYKQKHGEEIIDETSFFEFIKEFCYSENSSPCVVKMSNGGVDVFAHPYQTADGEIAYFDTLYQAEEYYYQIKNDAKNFKLKKDRIFNVLTANLKKTKKKISFIKARLNDAENSEENRIKGELIISNLYRIKNGEKKVVLDNYYDGSQLEIILDENLSPSQNAENYFKKYNKQKRAINAIIPQLNSVSAQAEYYQGLLNILNVVKTQSELDDLTEELQALGLIKTQVKKQKRKDSAMFRCYDVLGFNVLVGKNNVENDALIKSAHPSDMWFHTKNGRSSHLLLKVQGKEISDKIIVTCAEICAYFSADRECDKTEVVFAEKRYVKKPPQSPLGFVTYTDYKSVIVKPNMHEDMIKT